MKLGATLLYGTFATGSTTVSTKYFIDLENDVLVKKKKKLGATLKPHINTSHHC